ncbi:MAG TPA: hypothetical protein VMS77_06820 [Conexivisphaerales archaeon]|nr:hypothetical protein [Conexivisphaerales archaeon]
MKSQQDTIDSLRNQLKQQADVIANLTAALKSQPIQIAYGFDSSSLELVATTLTPVIQQGDNVSIRVKVFNPLDYGLQASAYLESTSLDTCGNLSPVDLEAYFGNYTLDNIPDVYPLLLSYGAANPDYYCPPAGDNYVGYTFYPHSDVALAHSELYNYTALAEVQRTFNATGDYVYGYDPSTSYYGSIYQSFQVGTYTVLASDVWGHQALCYFRVVATGPVPPLSIALAGVGLNTTSFTIGSAYSSFPGSEDLSLSIWAQSAAHVHLSMEGMMDGVWFKFKPAELSSVGPEGASSILEVAGAVIPMGGNGNWPEVTIVAYDDAGDSAKLNITLTYDVPVTILRSPSVIPPVTFDSYPDRVGAGQYGGNYYGVVYDPISGGAEPTLTVNLSTLGILVNGTVQPFPSWLQDSIPLAPFVLSEGVPYYFFAGVKVGDAPLGNFTVAMRETVGGMDFMLYINYTVVPPVRT